MPTAQRTLRAPNALFFAPVKAQLEAGGQATFRLTGRSMRPFLEHERDHVVVASARGRQIKRGDVVLAQLGDDVYVLHRVWRIEGDNMVLRGDGNPYITEQCRRGDIVAVAVGFLRGPQRKPCTLTSRAWRLHSALWPASPLGRRILLRLHRMLVLPWFPIVGHGRVEGV